MQDTNDRSYYASRAERERERANSATDPDIRRIHAELADRYEVLAIGEEPRPLSRQGSG